MAHFGTTHAQEIERSIAAVNTPTERVNIVQSWRRCIESYNLEPGARPRPFVLEDARVRDQQQNLHTFISAAEEEMLHLQQQMSGCGYSVILTDAQGIVLREVYDSSTENLLRRSHLVHGADWSEAAQGTNGIGTCIIEKRPLSVHFTDHFHSGHTQLTCTAAPIYDSRGKLLGVLDASSASVRPASQKEQHPLGLVQMSAHLIEGLYFLQAHKEDWVLQIQQTPGQIPHPRNAMLAIDHNGRINGTNPMAQKLLGLKSGESPLGMHLHQLLQVQGADFHIEQVFDMKIREIQSIRNQRTLYLQSLNQPRRIISTEAPRPAKTQTAPARPPSKDKYCIDYLCGTQERLLRASKGGVKVLNLGVSVLIQGETGCGKEVFARALHEASQRASRPFIAINCAAIPESLIESELFGYSQGAFTGARRNGMRGRIAQANGGTLFLDEIGDMPLALQTRLLRVLEERVVQPLGCNEQFHVDIQVISATHCNLRQAIEQQTFREDLFYRIAGYTLDLPPLRQRDDRQHLLCDLTQQISQELQISAHLSPAALQCLSTYHWPGNIREAINTLRTSVALCDSEEICLADLPTHIVNTQKISAQPDTPAANALDAQLSPLEIAERDALIAALDLHHWNVSRAAKALQASRNTIYRKLQRYQIDVPTR